MACMHYGNQDLVPRFRLVIMKHFKRSQTSLNISFCSWYSSNRVGNEFHRNNQDLARFGLKYFTTISSNFSFFFTWRQLIPPQEAYRKLNIAFGTDISGIVSETNRSYEWLTAREHAQAIVGDTKHWLSRLSQKCFYQKSTHSLLKLLNCFSAFSVSHQFHA